LALFSGCTRFVFTCIIGWAFGKKKYGPEDKSMQLAIKKLQPEGSVLFDTDRSAEYRAHVVQQL